ncbi:NADH-quinone oxidoreductase subunit NuoE [Litorimonas sp. RW-G-Af-16]
MALVQPATFELSKKAIKEIDGWVKKYPADRQRSALIPALWIAQKDADGWLPEPAMRAVADKLGMAYIRVYEVATFYTMFNLAPVGEHFVQLCGTTPCWLRGADNLKDVCRDKIGPQNTINGKLSWLEVECLGACANAPMVQISNADGDHYYEDLTADTFEALLDDLAAGKTPKAGPRVDRFGSEPEGGALALVDDTVHKQLCNVKKLPNADKKASVNYYEWDPKDRRATRGGWVDPKSKASRDPKKRPDNYGKDLTAGIIEDEPKKARPARSRMPIDEKPKVLYTDGPTDGKPDDLKKIKGVGPKFEGDLNAAGIYYYRQIGAWKAADIKTVEAEALSRFPGRIKRDEWVKQAKALAKTAAKKDKS